MLPVGELTWYKLLLVEDVPDRLLVETQVHHKDVVYPAAHDTAQSNHLQCSTAPGSREVKSHSCNAMGEVEYSI